MGRGGGGGGQEPSPGFLFSGVRLTSRGHAYNHNVKAKVAPYLCAPNRQQKMNKSDQAASQGCCLDFSRPCEVPIYPAKLEANKTYRYEDYGPGGLFWPYGGSGTFISAGLAMDVVGGANGWDACAQVFGIMNTDVQVCMLAWRAGRRQGLIVRPALNLRLFPEHRI